jgi:hypothetical protein
VIHRLTAKGVVLGEQYLSRDSEKKVGLVVHVAHTHPAGPAENAFIYVDLSSEEPRARYVSWINLFDIEYAGRVQDGTWRVNENAPLFEKEVSWIPFGWGGEPLPSIADRKP